MFELRLYDPRLGRWTTPDPYNQFWSTYLGMGNNPINGVDPDGGDWYKTEDGNEICILGVRGDVEGYTWLKADNYGYQIDEVAVTPKGNFLSDNTPRAYSLRDIPIRESFLSGDKNWFGQYRSPITRYMLGQEAQGNYEILNGDEYWEAYGHTLGNMMLMDSYIGMALDVGTPSPSLGIKGPKTFNYNARGTGTTAPKLQPRAPKGGTTINGKFYKGGQFIPRGSN